MPSTNCDPLAPPPREAPRGFVGLGSDARLDVRVGVAALLSAAKELAKGVGVGEESASAFRFGRPLPFPITAPVGG